MSVRRGTRLSIAIPSSLVAEVPHLREKTLVIGDVARAASIYRVDGIYIYRDEPDEGRLLQQVLKYVETPQYLRRHLIGRRPELSYAGVLPPLRTPHHPLEKDHRKLARGEFREGVVLSEEGGEFLVDIGVDRPLRAEGKAPSIGGRATVQVTRVTPELMGRFARKKDIESYWGFEVHLAQMRLARLLSSGEFDLSIATSRYGMSYPDAEPQIRSVWRGAKNALIAFGSPRRGLGDLLGVDLESLFDHVVNMIPDQGSETVRTEEALHATLAILNLLGG
ncbi:MAG TPA: RNA methyltransferase [Patescibacteria group bacterium]|nr:RNA methyltransferase [Patescibacteria group bacterium]